VEIGFSDGIKEISSKWGSWKFRRNGVHGNLVEMGFFKDSIKDLVEISSK
jgi:hypothetical protein